MSRNKTTFKPIRKFRKGYALSNLFQYKIKKHCFVFAISSLLTCQAYKLYAEDISEVEFRQSGGYEFPQEMLFFNVRSAKGTRFDQKILDEDVKRLFETGNFSDITTETQDDNGKIRLIFNLVSKPRIRNIVFQGNKKFTEEKLKDCLTIERDGPLSDKSLQDTLVKLRRFYADEGYNFTAIRPETKDNQDGSVDVVFNIDENLRKKVLSVDFVGNTAYSSWKLRNSVATQHSYLSWLFNMGLLNKDDIEMDKERLRELYWEKGYLDFKVEDVELKDDPNDPEYVAVIFHIFEGEPYKIQEVAITGNQNIPTEELLPKILLKTDETYNLANEKKDLQAINDMYQPLGYTDIECKAVKVPDFKTHTVNIEYRISEGRPYTVRDINISGNRNTKDYVIRRELAIQPGDPVDKNRIEASKARLMGMNYFENVEMVSTATDEADKKDVNIKVEEKDTWKFSIGAGMSDTDSLVGMVEISQINFDLMDPNNYFTGGGQRLDLKAQYGLERADFVASFSEPWLFDMPLRLDTSGYFHDRKYEDWNESRGGGNMFLTKRFLEFNSISLGYTLEEVRIYDMSKKLSEIFQSQKGSDLVSKVSAEIARDTRDSIVEPTSGYLLSLYGDINPRFLGASVNTYKTEAKASNYISFLDNALTLHTGIKAGQTQRIGSGKMVPLYERYFLGGGDTIRGFPYRSISPVDYNDDQYGGESMLLGNIELTHPIYRFIKGAVFTDFGNVWEKAWNMNMNNAINVGAGYGLRIKVPYINAPIKLDLAYPIVKNQEGVSRKLRFHFNMGF
ncbi:MAG: outer membrane protein assembly factor BamA, partial [Candidatus Nanoarchaeia archaeon]